MHPNEQPSSDPVNYYSRFSYDSRNRSNSRNRILHIGPLILGSLQFHLIDTKTLVLDIVIAI